MSNHKRKQYLAVYEELMQTALKGLELEFDIDDIEEQLINTLNLMIDNPWHRSFREIQNKYDIVQFELGLVAKHDGCVVLNDVLNAIKLMSI